MAKSKVTIDKKAVKRLIDDLKLVPEEIMENTLPIYQANTPIDKGNARHQTKKVGKKQLLSDYAYAGRLEDNWSKQTKGQGMTKPTIDAMQGVVDKIVAGRF